MLILLTILFFIFIPAVMLIIRLIWPRFSIQGMLVVLTVMAGWLMVFLARPATPELITLLVWRPESFFSASPSLLIDNISWSFALALVSLTLAVTVTSIAQLGLSLKATSTQAKDQTDVNQLPVSSEAITSPTQLVNDPENSLVSNWQSWAGYLILTSLGLVAVTASNMLTLILAWAALDLIELIILMGQITQSKPREKIVLAFTGRVAGIGMALLAGIIPWSRGISLSFDVIDQSTSIYLILAAGLRLGVFPLHLPQLQQLPLRRGLGTVLRLIPASASYILLVRVANVGVFGSASPYLLILTTLAGLYAGFNWLNAKDEINGRPFWLIGTASLVIISAILNRPLACITWSLTSLLSGALVFSMSIRHRNLIAIITLALINLSALPFTSTWLGTSLYEFTPAISIILYPYFFYLLAIGWLLIHALLLAGFYTHIMRGIILSEIHESHHIERWVWFIYPIGLILIVVTHFLLGFRLHLEGSATPITAWIMGVLALLLSAAITFIPRRMLPVLPRTNSPVINSTLNRLFSLNWLYNSLWNIYRLFARLASMISTILEGDGGILWAMVLFALIFVFLQR